MPSRKPDLTTMVHIRVPMATKQALEAAARAERRPLSNWVRLVLEDALRREKKRAS